MKKIGEIKGVPVVEGNINEVTKNQIHYKEDSGSIQLSKRGNDNKLNSVTGSSSSGGSSKYAPRYFSVDWDKVDSKWAHLLDYTNETYRMLQPFSTIKIQGIHPNNNNDYVTIINSYGSNNKETIKGFSYIPLYVDAMFEELGGVSYTGFLSFEQCIECINAMIIQVGEAIITLNGITEITEEEYYKID